MFRDSDPGCEVAGNDGIEQHKDKEREPEEQADDGKKEDLGPGGIYISSASGVLGVIVIVCNRQDGGREKNGKKPRDETDHTSLTLGPDEAGTEGQADSVVPDISEL